MEKKSFYPSGDGKKEKCLTIAPGKFFALLPKKITC